MVQIMFQLIYMYIYIFFNLQLLYAAMNLTTNEMFNYKRYGYLKDSRGKYRNPFSRGVFLNLAEFFLCVAPAEPEELIAAGGGGGGGGSGGSGGVDIT